MMIFEMIRSEGVDFFTGVPDSTLTDFCSHVNSDTGITQIAAACEGSAVSIAVGQAIASGRTPCVYMQNSGLPNALNPLLSIAGRACFDVPLLLVVGWRGQPGRPDEPQHAEIGAITVGFLQEAGFAVKIFQQESDLPATRNFVRQALRQNQRAAVVVAMNVETSAADHRTGSADAATSMAKLQALRTILGAAPKNSMIVTGIGHTAREVIKLRHEREEQEFLDLSCVGGMGFASHVAIGMAISEDRRHVICIDGDGSFLMHGFGVAVVGRHKSLHFTHILMDNGSHQSVGGYPVCNSNVDYVTIAQAVGYSKAVSARSETELSAAIRSTGLAKQTTFVHVPVRQEKQAGLPRPKLPPSEARKQFQRHHGLGSFRFNASATDA